MAAFTPITVADRKATPVGHTFTPVDGINGPVVVLTEKTGTPAGDPSLTLSMIRNSNGRVKPSMKLKIPILVSETVNGVTRNRVERTAFAELNLNFDVNSTLQERRDLVGEMANLMAASQTVMNAFLTDLEGLY